MNNTCLEHKDLVEQINLTRITVAELKEQNKTQFKILEKQDKKLDNIEKAITGDHISSILKQALDENSKEKEHQRKVSEHKWKIATLIVTTLSTPGYIYVLLELLKVIKSTMIAKGG